MHVIYIIKSGPKRVGRNHNWAEKDRAENKSGPKRDLPHTEPFYTDTVYR